VLRPWRIQLWQLHDLGRPPQQASFLAWIPLPPGSPWCARPRPTRPSGSRSRRSISVSWAAGRLGISHHLPPPLPRLYFRDSMNSPWTQGSVKPDLVLIDVRFRVACFLHSLLVAEAGPPSSSTTTPTIPIPPGGGVLPDHAERKSPGSVPAAEGSGSEEDRAGAGGVFIGEGLRGWWG